MVVRPEHSGQGIGKAMLMEAVRLAESNTDLRQLYLTVLDSNQRAQQLYSAAGFEKFAHEPAAVNLDGEYRDEWQMVLFLRGDT